MHHNHPSKAATPFPSWQALRCQDRIERENLPCRGYQQIFRWRAITNHLVCTTVDECTI